MELVTETEAITREEFQELMAKVNELHATFLAMKDALGQMSNNPMLKAFLPKGLNI